MLGVSAERVPRVGVLKPRASASGRYGLCFRLFCGQLASSGMSLSSVTNILALHESADEIQTITI